MGSLLIQVLLFLMVLLDVAVPAPFGNNTGSVESSLKRSKRQATLVATLASFDVIKNAFVEKHNALRRTVSPGASNMREISWDDDLERLAMDYSANCAFAHSIGLGTTMFSEVGENIHQGITDALSIPEVVTQKWFDDEVMYYTYNGNTCQEGKECSHYLQVVWAESYKLGCGISTCNNLLAGGASGMITICHYGPPGLTRTIINNENTLDSPYQSGEACSACAEGLLCNNSLCYSNATTPTTTTPTTTTSTTKTTTTTTTTSITTAPTTTTSSSSTTTTSTTTAPTTTTSSSTTTTLTTPSVDPLSTTSIQETVDATGTVPTRNNFTQNSTAAGSWQQSSVVTMLLVTGVRAMFCL